MRLSRRDFVQGAGALVIGFGLPVVARGDVTPRRLPPASSIDAWLEIAADGRVTVFTGKVELGTGVATALAQVVTPRRVQWRPRSRTRSSTPRAGGSARCRSRASACGRRSPPAPERRP